MNFAFVSLFSGLALAIGEEDTCGHRSREASAMLQTRRMRQNVDAEETKLNLVVASSDWARTEVGTIECPSGYEPIRDSQKCKEASTALGGTWNLHTPTISTPGCSIDTTESVSFNEDDAAEGPYNAVICQKSKVCLEFSGFSCGNGFGNEETDQAHGVNQVYEFAGKTLDGRPFYRGRDAQQHHIFYDSNCGGGALGEDGEPAQPWRSGWFVGCGEPSLNSSSNLQGAQHGGCCNTANLQGYESAMDVPLGDLSMWRWCGNLGDSGTQEFSVSKISC